MARVYGILSKYVNVSTSNEETMLDSLAEGAEGFKKGNPAMKITHTYRPSLKRAMELGVGTSSGPLTERNSANLSQSVGAMSSRLSCLRIGSSSPLTLTTVVP